LGSLSRAPFAKKPGKFIQAELLASEHAARGVLLFDLSATTSTKKTIKYSQYQQQQLTIPRQRRRTPPACPRQVIHDWSLNYHP
jgi:hypothetical protein